MGFFDLPHIDRFRTPGFVSVLDSSLEERFGFREFTAPGSVWRLWIIYLTQMLLLVLALAIGATIQSGLGLGAAYDAVDILRLIGGIPGAVAGIIGFFGVYNRMRYLLAGTELLNLICILFTFLAWAIDAADVADLNARIANPIGQGAAVPNFGPPRDKAIASAVFGALGWVVTIVAFLFTYIYYQEIGADSDSKTTTYEENSNVQHQPSNITIIPPMNRADHIQQDPYSIPRSTQPIARGKVPQSQPQSQPSGTKQRGASIHDCPSCGQQWPIDVIFCGECGSKIPAYVQSIPAPVSPSSEIWEEHFTEDGYMYYYNPKTGESKWAEA